MDTTTTTHRTLPISAAPEYWRAIGYTVYVDGQLGGSSWYGVDALLIEGMAATGANDWRVIAWAITENSRRQEAKTAATAQARLADSIGQLAGSLGAESAQDLVRRLPDKIRPYVEAVLHGTAADT